MILRAGVLAAVGIAPALGCHGQPSPAADLGTDAAPVADARPDGPGTGCAAAAPPVDIDLLLVVGSGPASIDAQDALLAGLEPLFDRLECNLGARPNLHVGVISADLGAGGFAIPRCEDGGDGGALLSSPQSAGCPAPEGSFVLDVATEDGRQTNYSGSLAGALECIAALGDSGCTFEQPAAAAIAALDPAHPANQGFVRDGALLAVIFAAGADDCSAADPGLFDPAAVDSLGPLSRYRCFEHGVVCDPDQPREPGVKSGCAPRESSTHVTPVADLAAGLAALKPEPADLFVAVVGGVEAVVVKNAGSGQVSLESSCAPSAAADPPIRLGALAEALSGHELSFCPGAEQAYAAIGAAMAVAARAP